MEQAGLFKHEKKTTEEKIASAWSRLDSAINEYHPIAVLGLFSGGHDSFCASYVASLHPRCAGVVHINTGIGIESTRDYVRATCDRRGWNLTEYKATENINGAGTADPKVYDAMVLKHGFPGSGAHGAMYGMLKKTAIYRLERDRGATKSRPVLLVSGCRQQESARRMGNTKEIVIENKKIWCAPILDWSKSDTSRCLDYAKQPRNPVVDLIHKSGECLCGAFARPGELEELRMWKETRPAYDRIKALEAIIKPLHGWGWEDQPPDKDPYPDHPDLPGMLCWSCTRGVQ